MAKKKKEIVEEKDFDITKYDQYMREQDTSEMVDENYMPYAMSIIISRALPDVRDGMKPSQRKVLYTMKNMNLIPGHKSKSANIAGSSLRLNPHSDQSCYETMVRMTDKNETLLSPYVAGKGSFGKHYSRDMTFAASRYCVIGNTLMSTQRGLIAIENIVKYSKRGKTYDDIDLIVKSLNSKNNSASKFFNSGEHDTYRVVIKNGMEITGTPNHPLLTLDRNGDICWKVIEDLAIGDKCVVDLDTSNALFGRNDDIYQAKSIASMIFGHDNLPTQVLEGTKVYQKEFLKHFFELYAEINKDSSSENVIYCNIRKSGIVKELQILLAQNFGILSFIEEVNGIYKLIIKASNIYRFIDEIGFESAKKCNLLDLTISNIPRNDYNSCEEIENKMKGMSSTSKKYEFYSLLKNYAYLEVISKEYAGIQTVYSVKVDSDCHSFSANGFINHNTEASLSALGMELFKGINKNAVDMMDNYDGTMKEPTVLPVAFPAVLANPTLGIAVGFASNICSFNMKELCEATIEKIKHPKSDLLDIMPGPDFSTGGFIIYNKEEMRDIYNTGRGSIKIRSKYIIDKKNYRIEIKEIPYTTTAEAIVESVIGLCKTGKIKEINDIRDDTDKEGLTVTIDYKRTCDPEQLMLKLFKMTPLEDAFTCNFNVIVDGHPRCLGVYSMLDEWINFRKESIVRMLKFDKADAEHRLHLLYGLEKILLDIDEAIKIIKSTEKDDDVVPNLMSYFNIDEEQAIYIGDMKIRNINKEYILSRTVVIKDLESQIAELKKKIESDVEIKKILISDLQAIIKKFAVDRKSIIVDSSEVENISDEPSVVEYDLKLYITESGYIKKIPAKAISETTEIKTKDDDKIIYTFDDKNKSDLLIFTNKTNVYKVKVSDIQDCRPGDFGAFLPSLIGMEDGEKINYIICTENYDKNLIIAFKNGKVALFPIKVYETKTNRKMLKNGFFDGSEAVLFDIVADDEVKHYIFVNNKKKRLVFTNKDVPFKTTKTTQGVQIIRLSGDVVVESCSRLNNPNTKTLNSLVPNNYPAAGR